MHTESPSSLPARQVPESFWSELSRAPQRALLLDFDGTLAPFHEDREMAFPYPEAREVLHRIARAQRTRVVVVSGRRVDDLPHRLGLDPIPELWGCHGFERRFPDGRIQTVDLDDAARAAISRIDEWTAHEGLGMRLECKPSGRALHWRGMPPDAAAELAEAARAVWTGFVHGTELELHGFDGGIEVRPSGHDKGDAVRTVLREMGAGTAAAYLGDDVTDEDAFQALSDRGLAVLVRRELRPTAAGVWLEPPAQLIEFLEHWHQLTCD